MGALFLDRRWLAIAAFVVVLVAGGLLLWTRLQPTIDEASIDAALKARHPQTFAAFEAGFSIEYAALLTELAEQGRRQGLAAVEAAIPARLEQLRARHAAEIVLAPDAPLVALMQRLRDLHAGVAADEGVTTCNRLAVEGPPALAALGLAGKYATALDGEGAAFFTAAAGGAKTPEVRAAVTDADWEAVGTTMAAAGASDAYYDALARLDVTDPNLCPAVTAYYDGMLATGGEAGPRIRAAYLRSVAVPGAPG